MTTSAHTLANLLDIKPQQNMSDKIYEQISQLIQNGELAEGYTFPNENVMCEMFSIGRSTIREAYKALELHGYVTRTKRGTVVNSMTTIMGATPLKAIVGTSSEQDFLEFRLMLESQTAGLASERATENEIRQLQIILDDLVSARHHEQQLQMADLDKRFHEGIATATHNPLMITAMAAVSEIWDTETQKNFFRASTENTLILDQMVTMHQDILNAIKARDSERASTMMKYHILNVSSKQS